MQTIKSFTYRICTKAQQISMNNQTYNICLHFQQKNDGAQTRIFTV